MTQQPDLYFEDFTPGQQLPLPIQKITKEEIIEFASEFDPQPMHLDEEAAAETMLGGLSASGWHTCSIGMRMMAEGFLLKSKCFGSPGVKEVKWLKPVKPGDILSGIATVIDSRRSSSKPQMGIVRFHFEIRNQLGDVIMTQTNPVMIGSRITQGAD